MNKTYTVLLAIALAALAISKTCWPVQEVAASTEVQQAGPRNSDCWSALLADDYYRSVWLGPCLDAPEVGGFRFVNVVMLDLECTESSATVGSVALADSGEPIVVTNATLRIEVAPIDGMTWREVEDQSDLSIRTDRL